MLSRKRKTDTVSIIEDPGLQSTLSIRRFGGKKKTLPTTSNFNNPFPYLHVSVIDAFVGRQYGRCRPAAEGKQSG
jgi:hypothetical protein